MIYPQPLFALLSLCLVSSNAVLAEDITTVPIYLPHYDAKSWSLVRGSVLSSVRKELQRSYGSPLCDMRSPVN